MKLSLLGALASLFVGIGTAIADCTSWSKTLQMAPSANIVIDEYLDNGDEFVLFVNGSEQVVVFMAGEYGGNAILGWSDDEDGVGTVVDGDVTCKFRCNGNGLTVAVTTPGNEEQWFALTPEGQVMKIGRSAFRQVYTNIFGGLDSDLTLVTSSQLSSMSMAVSGTNLNSDAFSLTALEFDDLYTDPISGDVYSSWVGTLTGTVDSVVCAGYAKASGGVSTIVPTIYFCNPADGTLVAQYLSQSNALHCPTCIAAVCAAWDVTAAAELSALINDSDACRTSRTIKHVTTFVACGAVAIVGCFTSWIPNPFSPLACWGGITCMYATTADLGIRVAQHAVEWNRVKNCICIGAAARAAGGTGPSCTFSCP